MKKQLEKEIIEFHGMQSEIADMEVKLSKLEEDIIKKYCPFKKGDKVIFTEWWRKNNKDYYGIINMIYFAGITDEAIDRRWRIQIQPTTKLFVPMKDRYNQSYKMLGEYNGDIIRKSK